MRRLINIIEDLLLDFILKIEAKIREKTRRF